MKLVESGKITYKQFEEKQKAFALQLVEKAAKLTIELPDGATSGTKKAQKRILLSQNPALIHSRARGDCYGKSLKSL